MEDLFETYGDIRCLPTEADGRSSWFLLEQSRKYKDVRPVLRLGRAGVGDRVECRWRGRCQMSLVRSGDISTKETEEHCAKKVPGEVDSTVDPFFSLWVFYIQLASALET